MLKSSVLIIMLLMGATAAQGQEYWPSEDEATFIFKDPSWGSIEYSFSRNGQFSTYAYSLPMVGPHVSITFDHDAEGNLRLVGSTNVITSHVLSYIPDRPIVLLRAQPQPGTTEIHVGTCTINSSHAPDEVFSFIARITVVGFETITVPAGTFETIKLNVENVWPSMLNGVVHLHRQLGLVNFKGGELESWGGVVASEPSSWGSVKALYR